VIPKPSGLEKVLQKDGGQVGKGDMGMYKTENIKLEVFKRVMTSSLKKSMTGG